MNYKNFINNEWFDSDSGRTFEVVNPFTETVIAKFLLLAKAMLTKQLEQRKQRSKIGAQGPQVIGETISKHYAQKSLAHADSLAKTISIEMGKTSKR